MNCQCEICGFEKRPGSRRPAVRGQTSDFGLRTSATQRVDRLQFELGKLPQLDMPLIHRFTPGMYIRELQIPKGAVIITKIHKTTHPFVVSQGHLSVWDEKTGVQHVRAPHTGITTPGTRRVAFAFEDSIWTTFHATDETDVEKIEAAIIEPHDVSYCAGLSDVTPDILRQLIQKL